MQTAEKWMVNGKKLFLTAHALRRWTERCFMTSEITLRTALRTARPVDAVTETAVRRFIRQRKPHCYEEWLKMSWLLQHDGYGAVFVLREHVDLPNTTAVITVLSLPVLLLKPPRALELQAHEAGGECPPGCAICQWKQHWRQR
jgi:hypothetical protein